MRKLLGTAFIITCIGVPGASTAKGAAPASVLITDVPHIEQKPDFCGEACAAMVLRKLGFGIDQDDVFDQAGVDPTLGRGAYAPELGRALRNLGFEIGAGWFQVRAANQTDIDAQFNALHTDLMRGVPSIVCTHYDEQPNTTEHFRLVLGYDAAKDEIIYHEPAEAEGAYRRMSRARFKALWPLKYAKNTWTIIRFSLEPKAVKELPPAPGRTDADYAQHILRLKERLPKGFTIVLQKPFVVIGDGTPSEVRRSAEGTVKWAVDRLKARYFDKDPVDILDIWLFKDARSYKHHTKALFSHEPSTPFGYYSAADKALVMNIATGGGTLVHEIVHPFTESNFEDMPAWFNEGLGSLYEQCAERDGIIWGLPNWRLEGLQDALRARTVPSFKALTATTEKEFYQEDPGTNYSQSRYLLHYLQSKGKLQQFYRAFHANRLEDPTGYKTLMRTLGDPNPRAFRRTWEAYVMGLSFP